jgi:hypothetical protein
VQIDDVNGERRLTHVGLGLTEAEATELRDALDDLLNDAQRGHEHVSASDYQSQLTVWIVR